MTAPSWDGATVWAEVDSELYRRQHLRAPQRDGDVLFVPPLANAAAQLHLDSQHPGPVPEPWSAQGLALRANARREMLEQARAYTESYRNVDLADRSQARIAMAGHQPRLYHPGVWIKNFALSALAKSTRAIAVNLVVDNDLSGPASIWVPQRAGAGRWQATPVAFDVGSAQLPFESSAVVDRETFASFPKRLAQALAPLVDYPLVHRLWAELPAAHGSLTARGALLAQARHRLEADFGLDTWELPISILAQTHSFAEFIAEIARRRKEFLSIHNESLRDFRQLYRIRSRARPVPALSQRDEWTEVPFWIWRRAQPARQRLFVRRRGDELELSDLAEWRAAAPANQLPAAIAEWHAQGLCLRPRALTTTLFARLFLSDLFLHGIGGAKYDQLGDWIAIRFYGVRPPRYAVATGTYQLVPPTDQTPTCELPDLAATRRRLWFQPEQFIPGDATSDEEVRRKSQLLAQIPAARTADKRKWHRELEQINGRLRRRLVDVIAAIEARIKDAAEHCRNQAVLSSRELSFCCFGGELGDRLIRAVELSR